MITCLALTPLALSPLSRFLPSRAFSPLVLSPGKHADRAELLPAAELHNLLQEFSSPLSALLGSTPSSEPSPLSQLIPLRDDMLKYETVPPGVAVRWVLGVSSGVVSRPGLQSSRGEVYSSEADELRSTRS
jgi:hypothetical protein